MIIYNLSTSDAMKKQLEPEFKALMSSIGASQPDPAWFINGEFVVSKLDRRNVQIKLGDGGYGFVFLGHFLDMGVGQEDFSRGK